MRYLFCILIALFLAGDSGAGQIFRGSGGGVAVGTISDDFETDTSANYSTWSGGAFLIDDSNSGIFQAGAWERVWAYNETTTGSANNYAEAAVEYTGQYESGGVVCRSSGGATPTGYVAYFFDGEVHLERFSGDTKTGITTYAGSYTYGASTTYTLKITCSSSTIKVFVDSTERISVTDTTYAAGNYIGVYSGRNVANTAAGVRSLSGGSL